MFSFLFAPKSEEEPAYSNFDCPKCSGSVQNYEYMFENVSKTINPMGIFTLYAIACRGGHEKPSGIVWTATAQGGTSRSHTSNIVRRRLAERVWWTKFQSPLLNICSRLSGFQSSLLLIYFRDGPNRCSLHQSMAQNLSDMWRSTFEIGRPFAASPRHIAPSQPFLCANRSAIWYHFGCDAKSIWYSVILNTAEIIDQLLT